jgi:nitrate reductase NapD
MTELHIASFIVRTRAEAAADVATRIATLEGAEIHAVEDGKIIVVVEAPSERRLADRMDELRALPEVLMVNLVYHQADPS